MNDDKFNLIVDGVKKLKHSLVTEDYKCYGWLDFASIDQNGDTAGELKQLEKHSKYPTAC